ncbi:hypothetical protein LJ725_13030 [Reyranella aquatilis]|uniref:Lipoprotein n=1 Tax=Reyranella aquatilis TaxID=2035356 RepID=A0ABS8KVY0_9HYPH|nr:hypothetical protein [Reyranella aquatilis]MCC8429897.1 hypothetical protein [Reyranella aquatilis]
MDGKPLAAVACLILSGCFGSSPSESDVKEAARGLMAQQARIDCSSVGIIIGCDVPLDRAVANLKLIGCTEATPQVGYFCDYTWSHTTGKERKDRIWLVKRDGRWQRPA